jgi:hypothetical protein
MKGFEGSLALKLDFGESATRVTGTAPQGRAGLRLASAAPGGGPDKYRALERRRRTAQIRARHLLDLASSER